MHGVMGREFLRALKIMGGGLPLLQSGIQESSLSVQPDFGQPVLTGSFDLIRDSSPTYSQVKRINDVERGPPDRNHTVRGRGGHEFAIGGDFNSFDRTLLTEKSPRELMCLSIVDFQFAGRFAFFPVGLIGVEACRQDVASIQ
jgi:hypothetical protein